VGEVRWVRWVRQLLPKGVFEVKNEESRVKRGREGVVLSLARFPFT